LTESNDGETLYGPALWSSRGESTTSKVSFYPVNMQEGLARGTK